MRVVTMRALTKTVLAMLLSASSAASVAAATVGERHLVAHEASAVLRNASHSDELRITVWYPAASNAVEAPLDIGPPGKPLFTPSSAADHGVVWNGSGATWAYRGRRRPPRQ
jgi:hypothetical protein